MTQKKYIEELTQKYKDLDVQFKAYRTQKARLDTENEAMARANLDLNEENAKLREEKAQQAKELEQLRKELLALKAGSQNFGRASALSIRSSGSQPDLLSPSSVSSEGSRTSSELKSPQQSPDVSLQQGPLPSPYTSLSGSSLWNSRLANLRQKNGPSSTGKKPLLPRIKGKGFGGSPA